MVSFLCVFEDLVGWPDVEMGVEVAFLLVCAMELLVEEELVTVLESTSGKTSGDEVLFDSCSFKG